MKRVLLILSVVLSVVLLMLYLSPRRGDVIAAPSHEFVLSVGHSDAFEMRFESNQLRLYYNHDTTGALILRNPSDVLMHVKPEAGPIPAPGPGPFGFLGPAGTPLWILPQTQDPNLLWPGLSTDDLAGTWAGNQVQLQLVSIAGPGNFFLFQNDQFGQPIQRWNSTDLATFGSFRFNVGVHAHANWVFTAQGAYTITLRLNGTHTTLGALTSGDVTYSVHVGPVADLGITKDVDDATPGEGGQVTFTLTASNVMAPSTSTGCCSQATGVVVNDVLPPGLSFVSATPSNGSYDSGTGVWTIGNLDYSASATLEIVAAVGLGTGGEAITNTATIASSTAALRDIEAANNSATLVITPVGVPPTATPTNTPLPPAATPTNTPLPPTAAPTNTPVPPAATPTNTPIPPTATPAPGQRADLQVSKNAFPARPLVGTFTLFSVQVRNLGPDTARDVVVHDDLPPEFEVIAAFPSSGSLDASSGDWTIGNLARKKSATLVVLVRVLGVGGGQVLTNTATASSTTSDPVPANNTASVDITPRGARTLFSQGHVDVVDIALEDGGLAAGLHDEDNDLEYEASEVQLYVKPEARTTVPDDPNFAFLGSPGASIWVLPQAQDSRILWPGLATEEVPPGELEGDQVLLSLTGVSGPGSLFIYTVDELGRPELLLGSAGGPAQMTLVAGQHLHSNWAFTEAGRYQITFEVTAQLSSGEPLTSGPVTYAFDVQRLGLVH